MTRALHPRVLLAAAFVLAVHAMAVVLVQRGWALAPPVAAGIAVDLTLTSALAVYLLAVRPRLLPSTALVPIVLAGAAMARWQLPASPVTVVLAAAWAAAEVALVATAILRVRSAARRARAVHAEALPVAALAATTAELLTAARMPRRLAEIVATEVTILAMVVTGWRRPRVIPGLHTVHVEKGWGLYAGVFVALSVVEAAGLHLALHDRAPLLTWILTAISAYGALWHTGDALALRHGGVRIADNGLDVAIGARWRAHLPWAAIASITHGDIPRPRGGDAVFAAIIEANVLVELTEPVPVYGPFGIVRRARRVALTVDGAADFVAAAAAARRA